MTQIWECIFFWAVETVSCMLINSYQHEYVTMNIQIHLENTTQCVSCVWRVILLPRHSGMCIAGRLLNPLFWLAHCGPRLIACIVIELTQECDLELYDHSPNTCHILKCCTREAVGL